MRDCDCSYCREKQSFSFTLGHMVFHAGMDYRDDKWFGFSKQYEDASDVKQRMREEKRAELRARLLRLKGQVVTT